MMGPSESSREKPLQSGLKDHSQSFVFLLISADPNSAGPSKPWTAQVHCSLCIEGMRFRKPPHSDLRAWDFENPWGCLEDIPRAHRTDWQGRGRRKGGWTNTRGLVAPPTSPIRQGKVREHP